MLKTTWSRRLPMYLPTSDFFAHLFGCFHAHRWQEAEENRLSIAPWNHERCAIFFVPPVGPFPTLGPLALVTAGFDAQPPATIQYDHLAAPLFRVRFPSDRRFAPRSTGARSRALQLRQGLLQPRQKFQQGLLSMKHPPLRPRPFGSPQGRR